MCCILHHHQLRADSILCCRPGLGKQAAFQSSEPTFISWLQERGYAVNKQKVNDFLHLHPGASQQHGCLACNNIGHSTMGMLPVCVLLMTYTFLCKLYLLQANPSRC